MTRLIARGSRRAALRSRIALAALALLSATASVAAGQNIDSLVANLSSPDVGARAASIKKLAELPVTALTPSARSAIIALLDREAAGTQPPTDTVRADAGDEGYGEYLIALTSLAATLDDVRALHGLAMIGVETSRAVEDFVAAQGAKAIPVLDTTFAAHANAGSSVVETWGRMLAVSPPLDSATRMAALVRIARNAAAYPFAAAMAASDTRAVSLLPDLYATYAADTEALSRGQLTPAINAVQDRIPAESAVQLLGDLATGTMASCDASIGNGRGACQAVLNLIATAKRHVQRGETAAAHNVLAALHKRAEDGRAQGELTSALAHFITELAQAAGGKI